MRNILWIVLILFSAAHADSLDSLLHDVMKDNNKQKSIDKSREAKFLSDLQNAKKLLKEKKSALRLEKQRTEDLKNLFEKQKVSIAKYQNDLDKKSENLKDLFSTLKQDSRDFLSLLHGSMTSVQLGDRKQFLEKISKTGATQNIDDIKKFWTLYLQEIIESGKIETFETSVIDTDGNKKKESVTRVGLFSAFNAHKYIKYDNSLEGFVSLVRQPNSNYLDYIQKYNKEKNQIVPILIDPTRGVLFSMLKEKPTIKERVTQGGIIGYIILVLGAFTLLFSLYRYLKYIQMLSKIKKQFTSDEASSDNPLGRILQLFKKHESKEISVLEGKMDAALIKEIPEIQSGLPMIKLVAAVAPLLGLLGTVTGMIETFQAITLFGSGDPKLMAGGISQALMTTVLGLVVAIPILFIYSILNSQSKKIIEILTQQTSALIAKKLEMTDMDTKSYDTPA